MEICKNGDVTYFKNNMSTWHPVNPNSYSRAVGVLITRFTLSARIFRIWHKMAVRKISGLALACFSVSVWSRFCPFEEFEITHKGNKKMPPGSKKTSSMRALKLCSTRHHPLHSPNADPKTVIEQLFLLRRFDEALELSYGVLHEMCLCEEDEDKVHKGKEPVPMDPFEPIAPYEKIMRLRHTCKVCSRVQQRELIAGHRKREYVV
jgi:hypothetical protein